MSDEEVVHYGLGSEPARWGHYLSVAAFHEVGRRGLARPDWDRILDDKARFAEFFAAQGLALPQTYGLLHPVHGCSSDGSPLRSVEDLAGWCRSTGIGELVLKPVRGWGSQGVVLVASFDASSSTFVTSTGEELSPSMLASRLSPRIGGAAGHLVQELCHQDPLLGGIGLGPSNAVRCITARVGSSTPEVQCAVLYAGRAGKMVNSVRDGALSIHIDRGSGALGRGRTLPRFGTDWLTEHPDARRDFVGAALPGWRDVRELCIDAATALPEVPVVCWELLLTDKGVRLLEGNLRFGLTMLQVHGTGFLHDGTAERWRRAGADLPDGSRGWARRHGARLVARRLGSSIRRRLPGGPPARDSGAWRQLGV